MVRWQLSLSVAACSSATRPAEMYEEEVELDGNVSRLQSAWSRKWQHWLDMSAPHTGMRWAVASLIMLLRLLHHRAQLLPPSEGQLVEGVRHAAAGAVSGER